jgi:hypothetical protein
LDAGILSISLGIEKGFLDRGYEVSSVTLLKSDLESYLRGASLWLILLNQRENSMDNREATPKEMIPKGLTAVTQ